jgi:hypothetical protein
MPLVAAGSSPSWAALVGAIAAVVVFHWLLPRVIFPRIAARRRPRPSLADDADPRRWATTVAAGLAVYVTIGLILGMSAVRLVIWGIAFLAGMAILYRRASG